MELHQLSSLLFVLSIPFKSPERSSDLAGHHDQEDDVDLYINKSTIGRQIRIYLPAST